ADVLRSEPDRVAVDCRRTVVTPARSVLRCEERHVPGEDVLGPEAGSGDVDVAYTDLRVERRIPGRRVVVVTEKSERDDAASTRGHSDRWIGEVLTCEAEIALLRGNARDCVGRRGRLEHEPGDSGPWC